MTPEAWGFLGVLATVISTVLVEQIRQRRRIDAQAPVIASAVAAQVRSDAPDLSQMMATLVALEHGQRDSRERLSLLAGDVGGLRTDVRQLRGDVSHLQRRYDSDHTEHPHAPPARRGRA